MVDWCNPIRPTSCTHHKDYRMLPHWLTKGLVEHGTSGQVHLTRQSQSGFIAGPFRSTENLYSACDEGNKRLCQWLRWWQVGISTACCWMLHSCPVIKPFHGHGLVHAPAGCWLLPLLCTRMPLMPHTYLLSCTAELNELVL